MVLKKIKNPFTAGSYGSFEIHIYDKYKELIAVVNKGVFLKIIPGQIIDVQMELGDKIVTRLSPLTLQFSPLHQVRAGDSQVKIEVIKGLSLSCPDKNKKSLFMLNSDIFTDKYSSKCGPSPDGLHEYILIDNAFRGNYKYFKGQYALKIVLFNT